LVIKSVQFKNGRGKSVENYQRVEQHLTEDDAIDLNSFGFKLAFSVHDYLDINNKYDDLSQVEWNVLIREEGNKNQIVGVHACTLTEFDQFYDVEQRSESVL
jgi:hypothetical protein